MAGSGDREDGAGKALIHYYRISIKSYEPPFSGSLKSRGRRSDWGWGSEVQRHRFGRLVRARANPSESGKRVAVRIT